MKTIGAHYEDPFIPHRRNNNGLCTVVTGPWVLEYVSEIRLTRPARKLDNTEEDNATAFWFEQLY